jgi:drug/metabolite transporter (DMT)-like permease
VARARARRREGRVTARDARPGRGAVAAIQDRHLLAIALALGAFLGFTGIDTCAKWLVLADIPTTEVVFIRYAGHLGLVLAFAWRMGGSLVRSSRRGTEMLRGVALLIGTALNFLALGYLPLTTTSSIFFTAPLWICLLSIPLLGEHVGRRRWAAIGVGFIGILIVTRPWSGGAHWAVILSLGSALCASFYAILTRMLAGLDSTATQQFHAAAIAAVGTAPFALSGWVWPADPVTWLAFCLIGVFGWAGHQLLTIAHRFAPASVIAPFLYVQIVYMALSGWFIFGDMPDGWVVSGASVVMASGLYIWVRERRRALRPSG